MKHEWRKHEKNLYLPGTSPEVIDVPPLKYYIINGRGNPNDEFFGEYIQVLYSLSYGIRMAPKSGDTPEGYYEYTVYPLEGVWDLDEEARKKEGPLDKDSLIFDLMIRQPDFVTEEIALETIEKIRRKKPHALLDQAEFRIIEEGKCLQTMHLGSYDKEAESFALMEAFCSANVFTRLSKKHREIYLNDARKTAPEKLKTVLRFKIS